MMPTRRAEILEGGSLYWIVKGLIQVRQPIVDITQEIDADGRGFARLHLGPALVRVAPRGHRPFQGWRYLAAADAPVRSEEHTSELQSLMRLSYAVFRLKKKTK